MNRAKSAMNRGILSFLDIDASPCISIGGNSIAVLPLGLGLSGLPISPRALCRGTLQTLSHMGQNSEGLKMAVNAQAIVDAELDAIETEQAAAFDEVADEATLISDIARGKAQIRATIEAECKAIAAIKADAKEANDIADGMANKPIVTALKAIQGGILADSEVNAILCDSFGSKEGKGKTPLGEGLSIRKRVRTLDAARRIAAGEKLEKLPTWAAWNDAETLSGMVESVLSGEASPSYVYGIITKRPESEKPILALDAKQIALLAEQLLNPATVEVIKASEALKVAYAALDAKLAALD